MVFFIMVCFYHMCCVHSPSCSGALIFPPVKYIYCILWNQLCLVLVDFILLPLLFLFFLYCVVASYLHPRVNTCWAACIQQGAGLAASPPLICTLSSLYPHKWPNPSQTPLSFVLYCTSFQTPCYQHRLKLLSVTSYSCLTTSHHLSCFPYYY